MMTSGGLLDFAKEAFSSSPANRWARVAALTLLLVNHGISEPLHLAIKLAREIVTMSIEDARVFLEQGAALLGAALLGAKPLDIEFHQARFAVALAASCAEANGVGNPYTPLVDAVGEYILASSHVFMETRPGSLDGSSFMVYKAASNANHALSPYNEGTDTTVASVDFVAKGRMAPVIFDLGGASVMLRTEVEDGTLSSCFVVRVRGVDEMLRLVCNSILFPLDLRRNYAGNFEDRPERQGLGEALCALYGCWNMAVYPAADADFTSWRPDARAVSEAEEAREEADAAAKESTAAAFRLAVTTHGVELAASAAAQATTGVARRAAEKAVEGAKSLLLGAQFRVQYAAEDVAAANRKAAVTGALAAAATAAAESGARAAAAAEAAS